MPRFMRLYLTIKFDEKYKVQSLLDLMYTFGVVVGLRSDSGTKFNNTVMTARNLNLHSHFHFTTPYYQKSNRSVE